MQEVNQPLDLLIWGERNRRLKRSRVESGKESLDTSPSINQRTDRETWLFRIAEPERSNNTKTGYASEKEGVNRKKGSSREVRTLGRPSSLGTAKRGVDEGKAREEQDTKE